MYSECCLILSFFSDPQLAESDGEVSQFDSLENCSDSGMSAENFNTLKKGPLAPIDPPPEFQVSHRLQVVVVCVCCVCCGEEQILIAWPITIGLTANHVAPITGTAEFLHQIGQNDNSVSGSTMLNHIIHGHTVAAQIKGDAKMCTPTL